MPATDKTITDSNRSDEQIHNLEIMLHHILTELHDQNKILAKLDGMADEAAVWLESPVTKYLQSRRRLKMLPPDVTPGD